MNDVVIVLSRGQDGVRAIYPVENHAWKNFRRNASPPEELEAMCDRTDRFLSSSVSSCLASAIARFNLWSGEAADDSANHWLRGRCRWSSTIRLPWLGDSIRCRLGRSLGDRGKNQAAP